MIRFRKLAALALALCLLLALCACGNTDGGSNTADTTPSGTQDTAAATQDDGKLTYTVKVVDESNNPIKGAMVQLCLESCLPAMTDDSGVATYRVVEADYKVSFVSMPEGYTCDETEFYFAAGAYDLTITLKAAA